MSMNIRGFCIGTGEWAHVAMRAALQMEAMTGVTCQVVDRVDSNLRHSSWHKLNLLRDYPGETLLIFDADLWCTRPWRPQDFAGTGLAMVPEPPTRAVRLECALYHVPETRYFNGGLIIADARAREVFAAAKKLHPNYGSWLEQTALNHNIAALRYPITPMPWTLNFLLSASLPIDEIRGTQETNLHFAGPKTVPRLHEIFDALEQG
jgi:hypothetical protein